MALHISVASAPSRSPPRLSKWTETTSSICIKCASAWDPCACAQPVCRCQLRLRLRYAPDARSSVSWDTSPRSPTFAVRVSSKRSMPFALAAHAANRSNSRSCEKTRKAGRCATSARQKRGHTNAPPARNTNLIQNSDMQGHSCKTLSTLAA